MIGRAALVGKEEKDRRGIYGEKMKLIGAGNQDLEAI